MRRLLSLLAALTLTLSAAAHAGEPPPPPPTEEHAAHVAEILKGLERVDYDELWERGGRLRALGDAALGAMDQALDEAGPKGELILGRRLMDVRLHRRVGAAVLLELASSDAEVELRIYAANSLGQRSTTELFGARWLLDGLTEAAAAEEDGRVKVALLRARGRLGEDDAAAEALLEVMRKATGRARKEAALALGDLGRASLAEVKVELLRIFSNDPTELADRALYVYRDSLARDPLFTEVIEKITSRFDAQDIEKIKRQELIRAAVRGMVGSLDPFSSFLDAEEKKELTQQLTGNYGGIGAYVNLVDGVFTIVSPIYGGPAYQVGLRSMDRVVEVDGLKTAEENMYKTISRLKGKPGTDVKVKIFRRGWREPREFTITRAHVSVDSIFSDLLPGGVGYLRIGRFSPQAPGEMREAIASLRADGAKGLIIDVRDNPGGYLLSAVALADEFLPEDRVIVSSKGLRQPVPKEHGSSGFGRTTDLPLVVLINSGSASASEILAGALRDNDRAVLIGKKSFGKGSVQEQLHLKSEPGAILKLTVARYYLPDGECIHEKGLEPAVPVDAEYEIVPGWKYEELAKATEAMEAYIDEAYKKTPELFARLAEDDGGDASRYPGLAEALKATGLHLEPEDVRPRVRQLIRRKAADAREKRFVTNLEDDRQLQRAAMVLLERAGTAVADLPAPYDRYAKKFVPEGGNPEAQAAAGTAPDNTD